MRLAEHFNCFLFLLVIYEVHFLNEITGVLLAKDAIQLLDVVFVSLTQFDILLGF